MINAQSSAWTKWISILGGLFLIGYVLLHPQRDSTSVLTHAWASIHFVGILAMVLITTGLLGIYPIQSFNLTRTGRVGFALAFIGSALYIGLLATDAFVNPILAAYAPETVHSAAAIHKQISLFGWALLLQPLAILMFIVGYSLFSVAAIRAKSLPIWISLALMLGAILFGAATLVPIFIEQVGGVFFALGQIGIGYEMGRSLQRNELAKIMGASESTHL